MHGEPAGIQAHCDQPLFAVCHWNEEVARNDLPRAECHLGFNGSYDCLGRLASQISDNLTFVFTATSLARKADLGPDERLALRYASGALMPKRDHARS